MPEIATATLGVWVGTGSRHEQPHEHGLSHLIEHMAFKGTARRSARQIAEDIENVGGDINAATSVEYTSYTARVLGENVDVALDVLGDILINSAFDRGELAREKGVILQEYAAVEDTPDDLDLRRLHGNGLRRPGRSAARSSARPTPSRASTRRRSAPSWRANTRPARWCSRPPATWIMPGSSMRPSACSAPCRPSTRSSRKPGRYTGGERRISRKLEQANLVLGLPGLSFKDPGYYATHLFAHILGGGLTSRLWHEVRETRGLAYSIDSFHWPFSDCGLFGIGAGTAGSDVRELMDVTLACMRPGDAGHQRDRADPRQGADEGGPAHGPGDARRPHRAGRAPAPVLGAGGRQRGDRRRRSMPSTVEHVREAGRRLLQGAPTLAAIGPIKGLPSLDRIASGSARLRFCAAPVPRSRSILLNPAANGPHCLAGNNNNRVLRTSRSHLRAPPCPQAS